MSSPVDGICEAEEGEGLDLTLPSGLERARTIRRRRVVAVGMSPGHESEEEEREELCLVMNLTAETGPVGVRRTSISVCYEL